MLRDMSMRTPMKILRDDITTYSGYSCLQQRVPQDYLYQRMKHNRDWTWRGHVVGRTTTGAGPGTGTNARLAVAISINVGPHGEGFSAPALAFIWPNEKVEQLAANNLTIPQDAIASLLQRLVRHAWFPFSA